MKTSAQRLWNITLVGLKAILRNKMRSLLTMLGIVIGVGCVIVVVAIGNGATKSIQDTINSLGSNFIMIFPGTTTQGGARMFSGSSNLTIEDADAIKAEAPAVAYVSPNLRTSAQTVAGELNWGTSIYGVGVDWPFIRSWNVAEGNFFTDSDVRSGAKVAILGATVSENLFPQGGAVGQIVRIKNVPFKVIGVLDRKGGSTQGQDQDDQIIAPYTTVMKRLMGQNKLSMLYASAKSPEQVQDAQDQIDALLRQRHRIAPGADADFMMRSQEEIASAQDAQMKILRTLLLSIAAISLLIGGIGIMNIMLVSVTERTREIGIRMAIGAKGRHVLLQFLFEAITLSIVGGLLGIGIGIGVSSLVAKLLKWPIFVSPSSILIAFGVAAAVGVFFGFYPARKAARLDPIDALRYE
ncbi:MAG: multidrug transporter substrate-binding protein [Acidobacteria bacterium]|jgi:putative ABC transport system permease protein|nr:multidrug transporter substrate-binding protein [Acidobacteriota bacterium]